jgi:hypothetical protein
MVHETNKKNLLQLRSVVRSYPMTITFMTRLENIKPLLDKKLTPEIIAYQMNI